MGSLPDFRLRRIEWRFRRQIQLKSVVLPVSEASIDVIEKMARGEFDPSIPALQNPLVDPVKRLEIEQRFARYRPRRYRPKRIRNRLLKRRARLLLDSIPTLSFQSANDEKGNELEGIWIVKTSDYALSTGHAFRKPLTVKELAWAVAVGNAQTQTVPIYFRPDHSGQPANMRSVKSLTPNGLSMYLKE